MGPSALLVRRKESLSAVTGKANKEKSKSLASSYEPNTARTRGSGVLFRAEGEGVPGPAHEGLEGLDAEGKRLARRAKSSRPRNRVHPADEGGRDNVGCLLARAAQAN